MDRVNATLLLSLKQEIKTLNEVIRSITQVCGCGNPEDIRSWLFPTKSYKFVDELIHDRVSSIDDFGSYVELIVDRLYVGICLVLSYIDQEKRTKEKVSCLVRKPKHFTLAFSFEALWTSISYILVEAMSKTTRKETSTNDNNIYSVDQGTQTDLIALNKCDSCSSAMLCMKNLLQSLEKDNTYNRRQILRPKIYDITQFGCMLQTTTTIENSLNKVFEKLFVEERKNEQLQEENTKIKMDIDNTFGKITLLEREVAIFKEKCNKDSFKVALLSSQNEELIQIKNKQQFQIKTLEEVINNLNKSLNLYKEKIHTQIQDKERINTSLQRVSKTQADLIKLSSAIEIKFCIIEKEHVYIEDGMMKTTKIVDNINNSLNTFTKIYNNLINKVVDIHKNLEDDRCFITSKWQKFQENIKKHIVDNYICDSRKTSKESIRGFQIKGDPVEDLTRQIAENNEKIKLLQKENMKLQSIILKVKRLKN